MITMDDSGAVIVTIDDLRCYDLSDAESYTQFLIWITSPEEQDDISSSLFDIDSSVDDETKPILERYSAFFGEFVNRRATMLEERANNIETASESYEALLEKLVSQKEDVAIE